MARIRHPNAIRLLNLGPTAAWRTQSVYQATAELMDKSTPDTVILCQSLTPYLSLGFHQACDAVLDRAAVERLGLPVARRSLGGGVQLFDANQLSFQCVFHLERLPYRLEERYALLLAGPVAALRRLGLEAALVHGNELVVAGRRVADVSAGSVGEAAVVATNIFFDFDYQTVSQAWRVPWEPFRQMAAAALRQEVTSLWRLTGPVTVEAFLWMLLEEFAAALGRPVERGTPGRAESRRAEELAQEMRAGATLGCFQEDGPVPAKESLVISARTTIRAATAEVGGYGVQATFRLCQERIEEAALQSEPARSWEAAAATLVGLPFTGWQEHLGL